MKFKNENNNLDTKNKNNLNKIDLQVSDNVIKTVTKNESIISLDDSVDGIMNISLQGNTKYKKMDGTYTDVWEKGVILESVGEKETSIEIVSIGKNTNINTSTIKLSEVLRSLPNGVKDSVTGDKLTRYVGKVIFDGSESWVLSSNNQYQNVIRFYLPKSNNIKNLKEYSTISCDKFQAKALENYEAISASNGIDITINKSKLTTLDLVGFKTWLQANPVIVYYELANPIIEKLPYTLTLKSFERGCVQINTKIIPTVTIKYPTDINSKISVVEDVINDLNTNRIDQDRILLVKKNTGTDKYPLEIENYYKDRIIASVIHNYSDNVCQQIDNVGNGAILKLKNAWNPIRRDDKNSDFVGTGNFIECWYNDSSEKLPDGEPKTKIAWLVEPSGQFAIGNPKTEFGIQVASVEDRNKLFTVKNINNRVLSVYKDHIEVPAVTFEPTSDDLALRLPVYSMFVRSSVPNKLWFKDSTGNIREVLLGD